MGVSHCMNAYYVHFRLLQQTFLSNYIEIHCSLLA